MKKLLTWSEMKDEVFKGIEKSPLIQGCLTGDREYASALLRGYWVFVDGFPGVIHETYTSSEILTGTLVESVLKRMGREASGRVRERFAGKIQRQFAGMQRDETSHRTLWLASASAIGLAEADLAGTEVPETERILKTVKEEPKLYRRCAFFAAVEIVAEGISRVLLRSSGFRETMTDKGLRWFYAHTEHTGETPHEEIARKSFILFGTGDVPAIEQGFAPIVEAYAALFVDAGAACVSRLLPDSMRVA